MKYRSVKALKRPKLKENGLSGIIAPLRSLQAELSSSMFWRAFLVFPGHQKTRSVVTPRDICSQGTRGTVLCPLEQYSGELGAHV